MMRLTILTDWTIDSGVNVPRLPALAEGESRNDITGQAAVPPAPNAVIWEVFTNDPDRYRNDGSIYILTEEELSDEATQ